MKFHFFMGMCWILFAGFACLALGFILTIMLALFNTGVGAARSILGC